AAVRGARADRHRAHRARSAGRAADAHLRRRHQSAHLHGRARRSADHQSVAGTPAGRRAGSSPGAPINGRMLAAAAARTAIATVSGAMAEHERLPRPSYDAGTAERHHYSITARVRPFVLFWISRSGVGDAIVTRQRSSGASYSLLIGSDPDRAPRRINRWGYIQEEIRDGEAKLIGLMTQSDEESPEEAEAAIQKQASGSHPFRIIQST